MAVIVTCPACGKSHHGEDGDVGQMAKCGQCGLTFTVSVSVDGTAVPVSRIESVGRPTIAESHVPEDLASGTPSPPGESLPQTIGHYRVLRRLGAGTMGVVWLAHDPDLERDVAIKVLPTTYARDPEYLRRFLREARLAAKLQHPNTVTIYQAGTEGGLAFMVMELVEGASLDKAVAPDRPMEWREATRAIRDAALGLAAAHEIGLIHRDIKPENLMRASKGMTKVVDFGLARSQFNQTRYTQQGSLLGTPVYMAPELWAGGEADTASDLYSLVLSYYFLLTGRVPFDGSTFASLGYQHQHEPLPDPRKMTPGLPDALCRILLRGAAKASAERYPGAEALVAELNALLATPPQSHTFGTPWGKLGGAASAKAVATMIERPSGRWPDAAGRRRRGPLAALALGAAGLCVLSMVLFVLHQRGQSKSQSATGVADGQPRDAAADESRPTALSSSASSVQSASSVPSLAVAPFDERQARQQQATWARHLGMPMDLTNSVGMRFALLPPGEFMMGSPDSDDGANPSERPLHRVRITKAFWLGVHEVTQQQYAVLMADNPSRFSVSGSGSERVAGVDTSDYPVERVSWENACEFCRRLSALPREQAALGRYRLPSEAEWEYACRAGTTTGFSFGTADSHAELFGWFRENAQDATHAVGERKPNAWGLCDMHGNVAEWCADRYDEAYYGHAPPADPRGPTEGDYRVIRGGAWSYDAGNCRSAVRGWIAPESSLPYVGFRVVREAMSP